MKIVGNIFSVVYITLFIAACSHTPGLLLGTGGGILLGLAVLLGAKVMFDIAEWSMKWRE